EEKDGRAEEEASTGDHEQAGDRGGAIGEALRRSGHLDGGARVAPGPRAEGEPGADHGDAEEAKGAEWELRYVLAALERDEGGGDGEEPKAGGEPAGGGGGVEDGEGSMRGPGGG